MTANLASAILSKSLVGGVAAATGGAATAVAGGFDALLATIVTAAPAASSTAFGLGAASPAKASAQAKVATDTAAATDNSAAMTVAMAGFFLQAPIAAVATPVAAKGREAVNPGADTAPNVPDARAFGLLSWPAAPAVDMQAPSTGAVASSVEAGEIKTPAVAAAASEPTQPAPAMPEGAAPSVAAAGKDTRAVTVVASQVDAASTAPTAAPVSTPAIAAAAQLAAASSDDTATTQPPAAPVDGAPLSAVISAQAAQTATPRIAAAPARAEAKTNPADPRNAAANPSTALGSATFTLVSAPKPGPDQDTEAAIRDEAGGSAEHPAELLTSADAPGADPAGPVTAGPLSAAAPATAQATPAVARATPETVTHLATQVADHAAAKTTQFDIALNPEGLGKVDVRLQIGADGALTASLNFATPHAASELRGRAEELHQALQQAGFNLADGAISFDVAQQGGQNQGQADVYEAWQDQNDRAFATLDGAMAATPGPSPSRQRSGPGLDIRI